VTVVYAQTADLGLSMGATPSPVKRGSDVTYTLTVQNFGPQSASVATLSDPLPSTARFVSASPSAGCTTPLVGQTGTVVCSLGSMANGASVNVQIVATIVAPKKTTVSNTASVSSVSTDYVAANDSATATVIVK
jgi:uncharacterized repeat protein (TIGR01451 family)